MSQDPKQLIIPTGESQVGRVQRPDAAAPAPAAAPLGDAPTPLVEHAVPVSPPDAVHAAPADALPPVPETAVPEPVLSQPVRRPMPKPLQESLKVPIPVRMNQLNTEHKRLRNELDALERDLKKTLS